MPLRVRELRSLAPLVGGPARNWIGAIFLLRLAERLLLAGVAVSFSNDHAHTAIAITALLGLLGALRGVARAPLLATVRRRFSKIVTHVLLRRRALAPPSARRETDLVIFEALWAAEALFADRLPGLAADALAAALLTAFIVSTATASMLAGGLAVLLIAALASEGARRIASAQAQRSWEAFLPLASSVDACIHGGLELVGNGRERQQEDRIDAQTATWIQRSWRADWLSGLSGRLPVLIAFIGVMGAIVYAQTSHGVPPEAALADGLVVASFLPPFAGLLTNVIELGTAAPKLAPLTTLLGSDAAPALPSGPARREPPRPPFVIRWQSIDYSYPLGDGRRGPPVLSDASGRWDPGCALAIAGPNGAGKSTLLRLFLGLDSPQRGAIFAGDLDFAELDLDAWRARVAYLPQRPFLPGDATVREAVQFLVTQATDTETLAALDRVGLLRRLEASATTPPLDTRVGELSAGERQRLALARVLLRDADVILLDEPDANLDLAGSRLLTRLIRELAEGRLLAFVAHDEEVLLAADRVLRLGEPDARVASGA